MITKESVIQAVQGLAKLFAGDVRESMVKITDKKLLTVMVERSVVEFEKLNEKAWEALYPKVSSLSADDLIAVKTELKTQLDSIRDEIMTEAKARLG